MRILLLHDYAARLGGAEVQVAELRDEMRRRGHDCRVLATSAGAGGADDLEPDFRCRGSASSPRILLQTANPWARTALRRALRSFRPDLVEVRMFLTQLSPLILPLLRDVPSVYHAVWYRAVCPTGTKLLPDGSRCREPAGTPCLRHGCVSAVDWPLLMLQKRLWERWRGAFDLVVANSEAVRDELAAAGVEPLAVVWNGTRPVPARPPLAGPPTAAFAGRLVPSKGVDVLLRAFARVREELPEARLLVLGDGPERPRLERLAAEPGLRGHVDFTGHVPHASVEARLAGAWVQAVPSVWDEPFGMVAVEAMMRGTAVVASDAGGPREIVVPGVTGRLVPPGDAEALARALAEPLGGRALAERMGAAGRRRALAEFTVGRSVDELLAHYEALLAGRAAA